MTADWWFGALTGFCVGVFVCTTAFVFGRWP